VFFLSKPGLEVSLGVVGVVGLDGVRPGSILTVASVFCFLLFFCVSSFVSTAGVGVVGGTGSLSFFFFFFGFSSAAAVVSVGTGASVSFFFFFFFGFSASAGCSAGAGAVGVSEIDFRFFLLFCGVTSGADASEALSG